MEITVLHIDECPGWELALTRVHEAVATLALEDATVAERVLRSEGAAAAAGFAGSPTVLVDGSDLFPSDGGTDALACRIYRTETGLAPAPTAAQIVEALQGRASGAALSTARSGL